MNIRTNSILTKIVSDNNYDFINQNIDLPTALKKLINSGFRKEQDCILFKDFEYFGPPELNLDFDKISYEEFLNDVHMDDYVLNPLEEFEYLKVGLEFSKQLYQKLRATFEYNFRIIISYNETTFDGKDVEVFGGCVVKFHTIRQTSDEIFQLNNLEEFITEGVMVIE